MRVLAGLILLPAVLIFAQGGPSFEAASVKLSSAEPGSSAVNAQLGRVSARNVTLRRCIRAAYDVPEIQVLGGPKWIQEERYDIEAKAAGPAGDHEMMVMLQSLLAERFKLTFHRETRPLNGYALVVAKSGLTAKHSAPDTRSSSNSTRVSIDAEGCSMLQLARKLSEVLHLPVADMTRVDGVFEIQLKWTPEDPLAKTPSTSAEPSLSLFDALQERLGLKLEARKVPTQVFVIDSAEKASPN